MKEQNFKPVDDLKYQKVIEAIQKLQDKATSNGNRLPFKVNMSTLSEVTGIYRQTIAKYIENMVSERILTKIGNKYLLNLMNEDDESNSINSSDNVESDELKLINSSKNVNTDELMNPQIIKTSKNGGDDVNVNVNGVNSVKNASKRKTEQSGRFSEDELFKLNRLIIVLRTLFSNRNFERQFLAPLKRLAGQKKSEMIQEFIWLNKKAMLTATVDSDILETLADLLSVVLCNVCGEELEKGEGDDLEKLIKGVYDPDNQPKSFAELVEESGIMNLKRYDDEDGEDEDEDEDGNDADDVESDDEADGFDDRDGWAERGKAGNESSNHKLITRPRNVCFVEFTPDEVEDIVNGRPEAAVHESPVKTFIYFVWDTLCYFYEEDIRNSNKDEESKQELLNGFKLEDVLVEPDDLKQAINEAYAEVKDLWKEGGNIELENEEGEIVPYEIDWSDMPLFDILEAEKVFRWERVKEAGGGNLFVPSKSHVFNLEETVPKPVRPERKFKDPVYEAYLRQNAEYITKLLDADDRESGKLNPLEAVIVRFIRKYYEIGESNLYPGCVKLVVPEKGVKDGIQLLDPSGKYLHHAGLNDFYRQLTDIRVSPEEFQTCLQSPVSDNSYHAYLKVVPNMFWAQGIAYICAQKGFSSHFTPSAV